MFDSPEPRRSWSRRHWKLLALLTTLGLLTAGGGMAVVLMRQTFPQVPVGQITGNCDALVAFPSAITAPADTTVGIRFQCAGPLGPDGVPAFVAPGGAVATPTFPLQSGAGPLFVYPWNLAYVEGSSCGAAEAVELRSGQPHTFPGVETPFNYCIDFLVGVSGDLNSFEIVWSG